MFNLLLHWTKALSSVNVKPLFPRIVDQASGTEIASFPIYKVLFCARGQEGSVESDCFSFTESYRSSEEFQIHVFSCHIKEAVSSIQILLIKYYINATIIHINIVYYT